MKKKYKDIAFNYAFSCVTFLGTFSLTTFIFAIIKRINISPLFFIISIFLILTVQILLRIVLSISIKNAEKNNQEEKYNKILNIYNNIYRLFLIGSGLLIVIYLMLLKI